MKTYSFQGIRRDFGHAGFLFNQIIDRDKADAVVFNMDALLLFSVNPAGRFHIDRFHKFVEDVAVQFPDTDIGFCLFNEPFKFFVLCFLLINLPAQPDDFRFQFFLLIFIHPAQHLIPIIVQSAGSVVLIDLYEQTLQFRNAAFILFNLGFTLLDRFFAFLKLL